MWEQIERNKRNSVFLIIIMFFFMLLLGAVIGILTYCQCAENVGSFNAIIKDKAFFNFASTGIITALVIWLVLFISALTKGKNIVLFMNHANILPNGAHRVLENIVEEMSIAARLPKRPDIYIIESPMPNAFATGLKPEDACIAVTTGLLTQLDRDELQGVIAHETAHIYNRDTTYMLFAGVMIGTISLMTDVTLRTIGRGSRRRASGNTHALISLICLILMIIAPIAAQLLYLSISRKREYLADACAVQFTRYPQGLASALTKISRCSYFIEDIDKVTSMMYIVKPTDKRDFLSELNSTHPPIDKRIAILSAMAGADFNAYNQSCQKVLGKNKTILSQNELVNSSSITLRTSDSAAAHAQTVNNPLNLMGTLTAAATVSALVGTVPENSEKTYDNDIIMRKRQAKDVLTQTNNYIYKKCECGTELTFPPEYKDREINCPHCNKLIKVTV